MHRFESGDNAPAREQVFELLEHIDHLHRTCVWPLFELVPELGGRGRVGGLAADPAVKPLFVLYALIPREPLRPVAGTATVAAPHTAGLIPLGLGRLRGHRPDWKVAFAQSDLPPGSLQ